MCSENPIEQSLGSKIEMNFGGDIKTYTLVGLVSSLEESERVNVIDERVGAVTLLDDSFFKDDMIVNACILTKNIHKIYDTTDKLVENLNLNKLPNTNKITPIDIHEIKDTSWLEFINSFKNKVQNNNTSEYINNEKVLFNTPLLNYACVYKSGSSFCNILLIARYWFYSYYRYLWYNYYLYVF